MAPPGTYIESDWPGIMYADYKWGTENKKSPNNFEFEMESIKLLMFLFYYYT